MPNTVETIEAGIAARIGRYADAVRIPAGYDQIVVSGTPGLRPDGTLPEGIEAQSEQAWQNIETILGLAGAKTSDIVSVRQWVKRETDIPAYVEVRKRHISHLPVFMLAAGTDLVWPSILVEVEVVAAVAAQQGASS